MWTVMLPQSVDWTESEEEKWRCFPTKKKPKGKGTVSAFNVLLFRCCCCYGDIHRGTSSNWMRMGKGGETSHPEEVLITVLLISFPTGCFVVPAVKAWGACFVALPLPVRLIQKADQVLVALLLKMTDLSEFLSAELKDKTTRDESCQGKKKHHSLGLGNGIFRIFVDRLWSI